MRTDVPSPFNAPLMTLNLAAVATASQNAFQKKSIMILKAPLIPAVSKIFLSLVLALTFGQR